MGGRLSRTRNSRNEVVRIKSTIQPKSWRHLDQRMDSNLERVARVYEESSKTGKAQRLKPEKSCYNSGLVTEE